MGTYPSKAKFSPKHISDYKHFSLICKMCLSVLFSYAYVEIIGDSLIIGLLKPVDMFRLN